MDPVERSAALEAEGSRLLDVAAVDLEADVPACPGWRVAELLGHVANGWEAFRVIVESGSTERLDFGRLAPTPEEPDDIARFAAERLSLLVPVIASSDPGRPVWTWSGVADIGFYHRRTLIETTVHRVDAEQAVGTGSPIDPDVAFDGVDELYAVLLAEHEGGLPDGSLHLHQTDGDGELMLAAVDGRIVVTHEHGKGDAAVRAGGADLLLGMYGRRSLDGLEMFGDRSIVEQWIALAP